MLHNAFLVHDDIEDESELRRGLPTMHAEHGVPIAVNAGDMLTALSVRILRDNLPRLGPPLTSRVYDEFEHMMQESLEGQAMELGWVRDNRCDVTDEDYLRMVLKKTCWYSFIHPCRIGALIAHEGRRRPGSLQSLRMLPWHGVPDSGRSSQPHGRRTALRQGDWRRPARGQAHADADPSAAPAGYRAKRARVTAYLGQPRAAPVHARTRAGFWI